MAIARPTSARMPATINEVLIFKGGLRDAVLQGRI